MPGQAIAGGLELLYKPAYDLYAEETNRVFASMKTPRVLEVGRKRSVSSPACLEGLEARLVSISPKGARDWVLNTERRPLPNEPFDVILLNDVVHELHRGHRPPEFLGNLFRALRKALSPEGAVILGDVISPSWLRREEMEFLRDAQRIWTRTESNPLGHGDSPEVFLDPDFIVTVARSQGFLVCCSKRLTLLPFQDRAKWEAELRKLGLHEEFMDFLSGHGAIADERLARVCKDYYLFELRLGGAPERGKLCATAVGEGQPQIPTPPYFPDEAGILLAEGFFNRCRPAQRKLREMLNGLSPHITPDELGRKIHDFLWKEGTSPFYKQLTEAVRTFIEEWGTVFQAYPRPKLLTLWPSYESHLFRRLDAPRSDKPGRYDEQDRRTYWFRTNESSASPAPAYDHENAIEPTGLAFNAFLHRRLVKEYGVSDIPSLHDWMVKQRESDIRSLTLFVNPPDTSRGSAAPSADLEDEFCIASARSRRGRNLFIALGEDPLEWGNTLANRLNEIKANSWPPKADISDAFSTAVYNHFLWALFLDPSQWPLAPCDSRAKWELRRQAFVAEAALHKRSLEEFRRFRVMTVLGLRHPVIEDPTGSLILVTDRVLQASLLNFLGNLVTRVLSELRELEIDHQRARERAADERAKERAALIPKWAHGQRITLFAVSSCLAAGTDTFAVPQPTELGGSETIANESPVAQARRFITRAYDNVDLLQEMGHYEHTPTTTAPRWREELYGLDPMGSIATLRETVQEAIVNGLVRLFAITDSEKEDRYRYAFLKFFLPPAGIAVPETRAERDLWPPSRVRKIYRDVTGIDLNKVLCALRKQELGSWDEVCKLASLRFDPKFFEALDSLCIPVDGSPSPKFSKRPHVFQAAIRMAVEEAAVNYVKHGQVSGAVRNSFYMTGVVEGKTGELRRAKTLMLNAAVAPSVPPVARKGILTGQEGVHSGLLLCDYVLRAFGGGAVPYRSWVEDERRQVVGKWERIRPGDSLPEAWFAVELDLPGKVIYRDQMHSEAQHVTEI